MAGLADADKFRPPGGLLADELLWADGRRSIRDINRMIELSGGKGDLSRLMELYALLATAGHVNYSSRPAPETDREGLLADLRRLGVREGMVLTVHSSLRALGFVIGGAVAVLEALLEAVGENGTLVMPTFNRPTELFVPEFTPATTGLLAEFLRYRSGAVRSVHPALSVAALGPEAGYIVEGHRKATATGEDSPLHRASKKGGYVLLLGVGQDRNSTVHVGESLARSPYRHLPYNPELHRPLRSRLPDGSVAVFEPDELGGCSNNFGVLDERLRDAGRLREGRVGLAPARLMKGDDLITAVKVMLAEDPASLLCRETFCGFCPRARAALAGVR
jgi:aminoglycoside N3'-acetyltransferase